MSRFIIVITLLAGLLVASCSNHSKDDRVLMALVTENFDQSTRQFMLVSREKLIIENMSEILSPTVQSYSPITTG